MQSQPVDHLEHEDDQHGSEADLPGRPEAGRGGGQKGEREADRTESSRGQQHGGRAPGIDACRVQPGGGLTAQDRQVLAEIERGCELANRLLAAQDLLDR